MVSKISIFSELKKSIGDQLPIFKLTKATLVHLSHVLEDAVITKDLPALIFTGFQESSHWRKETRRYEKLANVATQTVIFAGKPIPETMSYSGIQIGLDEGDPLRQEWFLLIFSTQFTAVLAGLDQIDSPVEEAQRQFEFIWSFDEGIVSQILDVLEQIVQAYNPHVLEKLQQARRDFPPVTPSPDIITRFSYELLRLEDILHREISMQRQKLLVSFAKYNAIMDNVPICNLDVDPDGMINLIEGSLSTRLASEHGITVGTSLYNITDETFTQLPIRFADIVDNPRMMPLQSFGEYELKFIVIYDGYERLSKVVIVVFDMSQRIESEIRRVELLKQQELNELRRQLMMTLSHEVRTPLTTIATSAELLDRYFDRITPENRQERLATILREIEKLKTILDDINAVVHADAEPFGEELMWVNLHDRCMQVIEDIMTTYNRDVTRQIDEDLTHVYTDPRIFRYVLTNLLSNAIKYSDPDTQVTCTIKEDYGAILIQVTDEGIGIPPSEQKKVITPFFRGSNVGRATGTGLGLAIIHNTITRYGGTMEIQSEVNQGTTITIRLLQKRPNPSP